MGLTKDDLLCQSRFIRDTLAPAIAQDGGLDSGKHHFDLSSLRAALDQLINSPMTLDTLRYSRMEKALQRIVEAHGGNWPPDIVLKARTLIARWETTIGPLQRVRTDFWGPGGRLEGFAKPQGWFRWEGSFQQVSVASKKAQSDVHPAGKSPETPAWSAVVKRTLGETYKEGHCGFKVGDWWLNGAAACRDGIIDNLHYRITADNRIAYAIAMTQGNEKNVSKNGSSSYTPFPNDVGAFKLMATISGGERGKIRVLRSWRLQSPYAPAAGIRYDGLYQVTGYGVKLVPGSEGKKDSWRYTFHIKREPCQASMEKALAVPMPDQLDDWEDYRAGPMYSPDEERIEEMYEGAEERKRRYTIGEDTARFGSIDSGYFSANPSDIKKSEVRSSKTQLAHS
ncbi:MAG: hypothetical protein Q9182_001632 [Xanthomendoza sp. 2 TL-2023]